MKLNEGLIYTNDNCIGCNHCISGCPVLGANVSVTEGETNRIYVDGDACIHCGKCLEVCPHNARECIHDFRTSVNNVFPAVAGQNENGYVS